MAQLKLCESSEGSHTPHFKVRTFSDDGEFIFVEGFFNVVIDMPNNKRLVIHGDGKIEEKTSDGS
jgi:hypothetical protein